MSVVFLAGLVCSVTAGLLLTGVYQKRMGKKIANCSTKDEHIYDEIDEGPTIKMSNNDAYEIVINKK